MYRTSSDVTPEDTRPLAAELDAALGDMEGFDPTAPGYGHHLPFDRILRRCGLAWTEYLRTLDGFDGSGLICPRLEVDYHAEVGVGTLDVDVTVTDVGRTSFRLRHHVSQDGRPAATVDVVLVCFSYETRTAVPLTDQQRQSLELERVTVQP